MRGGTSAAREGFVGARQEGTMPEVQFARARKQQRGRDGVAPFMDAAVVVIPRRAGSFRGPGGGGGDPATAARTTEAPRAPTPRARARSRRAPPALSRRGRLNRDARSPAKGGEPRAADGAHGTRRCGDSVRARRHLSVPSARGCKCPPPSHAKHKVFFARAGRNRAAKPRSNLRTDFCSGACVGIAKTPCLTVYSRVRNVVGLTPRHSEIHRRPDGPSEPEAPGVFIQRCDTLRAPTNRAYTVASLIMASMTAATVAPIVQKTSAVRSRCASAPFPVDLLAIPDYLLSRHRRPN